MLATSEVIRISLSDFPECINESITDEIIEWLGKYLYEKKGVEV